MAQNEAINHELEEEMELHDDHGSIFTVARVRDDGSVVAYAIDGESEYEETWTEEEICTALVDGVLETPDGKSHELVDHF